MAYKIFQGYEFQNFVQKLEFLCIETIGKNILRYSRTHKQLWEPMYLKDVGQKLILSSISSSGLKDFDETCYEFILKNFYVGELKIFSSLFSTFSTFNFLNGLSVENFEINLTGEVTITDDNFHMTAKKFRIIENSTASYFLRNFKFFSNVQVETEIIVVLSQFDTKEKPDVENLLLILLENTSKNIETIEVPLKKPSRYFFERAMLIMRERKYLKKLNIMLDDESTNILPTILMRSVLTSKYRIRTAPLDLHNVYFENFEAPAFIENLHISCYSCKITDKQIIKYLKFIQTVNLTFVKKICLNITLSSKIMKAVNKVLERCSNLRRLESLFIIKIPDNLPCFRTLKVLHLKFVEIDSEENLRIFENCLNKLSLEEIELDIISLSRKYSSRFFEPFFRMKYSLTSLSIYCFSIMENTLEHLPKLLRQLTNLKCFKLHDPSMNENLLKRVIDSLQYSSKNLEELYLEKNDRKFSVEYCRDLLELLRLCDKLKVIDIKLKVYPYYIPDLIDLLKKFKDCLKKLNICLCAHKDYIDELKDLLSVLSNLEYLQGASFFKDCDRDWEFIEKLYNSRNSLKHIEQYNSNLVHRLTDICFPRMLMSF